MTLLAIASLAGIYFGLSCSFLVLAPLTVTTIVALVALWACHVQTIAGAFLSLFLAAIGLQLGYVIGLSSRDLWAEFTSRLRTVHSKSA